MSDSRFHLEVKFEVYGKKFAWKPSLNWSAEPGECDERISRWFAECHETAYSEFAAHQFEHQLASEKAREEEERATLARLKAKYEG